MTVKGGTSQACAACKYQRRKCANNCPLKPYFPADQPKMFQNAHRLFGVSNILKIISPLPPSHKSEAMRSIIYQSNIRDKHRVHGCVAIIEQLRFQIQQAKFELEAVNAQLAMYRQQYHNELSPAVAPPLESSPCSQLQLGMGGPSNNNAIPLLNQHPYQMFDAIEDGNSNATYSTSLDYIDNKDNIMNPLWAQQSYMDNDINNNSMVIHQSQFMGQPIPLQQLSLSDAPQDYDEMPTVLFDTIDDRQSFIHSKDPYESRYDVIFLFSSSTSNGFFLFSLTTSSLTASAHNPHNHLPSNFSFTSVM
ncbi:hypothetical protein MKW94_004555 [Papaver nudicaule]|uniref:LOB domain-containing protein n=1 Tax=Papaver nudicaule TaxID=74823 RepID=A0AA41VI21_PAPNU|nr:hypothetical protein [Papaver nudicaule]